MFIFIGKMCKFISRFKNISNKNSTAKNIQDVFSQKENDMTNRILTWENACQLAPLDMSDLRRSFAPAGQSTQMIIGATQETDYHLLKTTQALYQRYDLKRVFFSAYVPLNEDKDLPSLQTKPPLLREHRLYQADWLLRFYGFQADELLSEAQPNFNDQIDPKCDWALAHLEQFPVEVSRADYALLLRVPGIGPKSAQRIVKARRQGRLDYTSLKRMGVVLKRAVYFITCEGRQMYPLRMDEDFILHNLLSSERNERGTAGVSYRQLSLFDDQAFSPEEAGIQLHSG